VQPQGTGDDDTAPVVASWEEALALHGRLHAEAINPAWLAALISDRKTADQAPYRRIARLSRGSPRGHPGQWPPAAGRLRPPGGGSGPYGARGHAWADPGGAAQPPAGRPGGLGGADRL